MTSLGRPVVLVPSCVAWTVSGLALDNYVRGQCVLRVAASGLHLAALKLDEACLNSAEGEAGLVPT